MEQLGPIIRALCLGLCVCGLGIGVLLALFLGVTGRGVITVIQDILGVGGRDEDELIDEAVSSIHERRVALQKKKSHIKSDSGIPDFDAAVAKYANQSEDNSFSSHGLDAEGSKPSEMGSGNRFDKLGGKGIRGKRFPRDDDYEIYDDGEGDFLD